MPRSFSPPFPTFRFSANRSPPRDSFTPFSFKSAKSPRRVSYKTSKKRRFFGFLAIFPLVGKNALAGRENFAQSTLALAFFPRL
jgi:hypothetical protein